MAQPFATSYIRTEGSTVTRAADDLSLPSAGNLPSSSSPYSIHSKIHANGIFSTGSGTNQHVFASIGETNRLLRTMENGTGRPRAFHGATALDISPSIVEGESFSLTMASDNVTGNFYKNGVLGDTETLTPISGVSTSILIGSISGSVQHLFGHIKTFSIYEEALTSLEVGLL